MWAIVSNWSSRYYWSRYWTGNFSQESLQKIKANIEGVPYNPVNPIKAADVTALFKYLEESSIDFIKKMFEESDTSFRGISVPESDDEDPVAPVKLEKIGRPRKTTDSKKGGPPRKGIELSNL